MKSNKELGICRIPNPYGETVAGLVREEQIDISMLDKAAKLALGLLGRKTGAFKVRKGYLLERTRPFIVIKQNQKYVQIQIKQEIPLSGSDRQIHPS